MMKKSVDMEIVKTDFDMLCESIIRRHIDSTEESSNEKFKLLNEFTLKEELRNSYVESSEITSNPYKMREEATNNETLKENSPVLSGDMVLGRYVHSVEKDDKESRLSMKLEKEKSRNQLESMFQINQHLRNDGIKKVTEDHMPVKNYVKNPPDLKTDMNSKMLFRKKNKLLLEMILKGQEGKKSAECFEKDLCLSHNVKKNGLDQVKNVDNGLTMSPSGSILSENKLSSRELLNNDYRLARDLIVRENLVNEPVGMLEMLSDVCANVEKGKTVKRYSDLSEDERNFNSLMESNVKGRLLMDVEMKEDGRSELSENYDLNFLVSNEDMNNEVENIAVKESNVVNSVDKTVSENKIVTSEDLLNAQLLMQLSLRDEDEKVEKLEMNSFLSNGMFEKQVKDTVAQETNFDDLSNKMIFGKRIVSSEELLNATLLIQLNMNEEERNEFTERLEMNSFVSNEIFENQVQDIAIVETSIDNSPDKIISEKYLVDKELFNNKNQEIHLKIEEKEGINNFVESFEMDSTERKFEDAETVIKNLFTLPNNTVPVSLVINMPQEENPEVINNISLQSVNRPTIIRKQQTDLTTAKTAAAAAAKPTVTAAKPTVAAAKPTVAAAKPTVAEKQSGAIHSVLSANVQNEVNQIKCNSCGEVIESEDHLKKHICLSFSCNECQKSFTKAEDLTRHWYQHTNIRNLICSICRKKFIDKSKLSCHMISHSNIDEHVCQVCYLVFLREEDLSKHLLTHGATRMASRCHICGKSFQLKSDLHRHLASHKLESTACKTFTPPIQKTTLSNQRHSESTNNVEKNKIIQYKPGNISQNSLTKCLVLEKSVSQQVSCNNSNIIKSNNMIDVKNVSRNDLKDVSYQLCYNGMDVKHSTIIKSDVENVLPKVLSSVKSGNIENIKHGNVVESKIGNDLHKDCNPVVNQNTPQVPCNIVDNTKSSDASESNHKTIVNVDLSETFILKDNSDQLSFNRDKIVRCNNVDEPVKCNNGDKTNTCHICRKTLSSPKALQMHILRHKDIKDHNCNICGKSFVEKRHLLRHEKTHKDIRDFVCKVCGKSYVENYLLIRHMYQHTGDKPFSCNICSKSFMKKDALRKHYASHSENRNEKM